MKTEKKCAKCGEVKPIDEFHKNKYKKDGRISRCRFCISLKYVINPEKEHAHQKASRNRTFLANVEKIREKNRSYRLKNFDRMKEKFKQYRLENAPKVKAQTMARKAISRGEIIRLPCEVCGSEKTHAHHDDYAAPLSVRFLCVRHHAIWHAENGESPNGKTIQTK